VPDKLSDLTLSLERIDVRSLRQGERETTELVLHGGGEDGLGEDVTYDRADRDAFRAFDLSPLRAAASVGEFVAALDRLRLNERVSWPVVASYRRWALESAALDLALRQADLPFASLAGIQLRPVRFVVSLRVERPEQVLALLQRRPSTRLKLDALTGWTDETIEALAATRAVEIIDLKGTAPGSGVHAEPEPRRYEQLAAAFPAALFEDPAPELAQLLPRVAWDEPVHTLADLDRLPPADAVNVKPARLGGLATTIELVEACRSRGITAYGGGHSELGVGRGQLQLLAAALYPDAPNDVAPDDQTASPLPPPTMPPSGFRWPESAPTQSASGRDTSLAGAPAPRLADRTGCAPPAHGLRLSH
jgi:L-alanine-DL-glutamate epimerase-like enolase superfamily enzyme